MKKTKKKIRFTVNNLELKISNCITTQLLMLMKQIK